ncbi:hypothetical protein HYN48_04050 [Flavobacterium magnum]|uniref:DUF2946 domain-containing protein n=1 Tax=Flavobacterium magnum TaxID=2162713 RepID=A0A2S0RCH3_9FLAO|nr:DUF2946 family protein [Flavobacterium magnum]AWA29324.1 hypothetical protein HYN48_04050 [Flavobacterium magnum]
MKNRLAFLNVFFALSMLAAIVSQSVHEIAHYAEFQKERHCHHEQQSRENISHEHVNLNHCPVCDLAFTHFTTPDIFGFRLHRPVFSTDKPFSQSNGITQFFRGSLFALRAPPTLV